MEFINHISNKNKYIGLIGFIKYIVHNYYCEILITNF